MGGHRRARHRAVRGGLRWHGQPAILGTLNQGTRPTIFENTGDGPAITFKTKATKPPFTVTSAVQVPNLNATKLGGKLPSAFAPAGLSYTKTESDAKFAPAGAGYTKPESDGKYAATGSSYSKAESDGKFAVAAGTYTKDEIDLGFVPKGALADYYTKTASDAAFAPAVGSASYVPAGFRVITTFGTGLDVVTTNPIGLRLTRTVTARADGTIFISVTGTCYGSNPGDTGTVAAQAGAGPVTQAFVHALTLCDVTDSATVTAGETVTVQADLTPTSGQVAFQSWSGTVFVVPS